MATPGHWGPRGTGTSPSPPRWVEACQHRWLTSTMPVRTRLGCQPSYLPKRPTPSTMSRILLFSCGSAVK